MRHPEAAVANACPFGAAAEFDLTQLALPHRRTGRDLPLIRHGSPPAYWS